jgi:hypothetical protein
MKDNYSLEQAYIFGILRVAKEDMFSSLNNVEVDGFHLELGNQMFGFTEEEVQLCI